MGEPLTTTTATTFVFGYIIIGQNGNNELTRIAIKLDTSQSNGFVMVEEPTSVVLR